MRISTLQFFNSGVSDMTGLNSQVVKTQSEISSGTRVETPADDPVAAARILQLEEDAALRKQYDNNIDGARGRLEYEEGVLTSVNAAIQRVNELTIQAGNGSYNQENRASLAKEITVIQDQLASLVNSKNASGEYLFGGFQGGSEPFERQANGAYVYKGDEGQRFVQIASSTQIAISDSGKDIFVNIPSAKNSFSASASPVNTSVPPAMISPGVVVDQAVYDEFYPEDIIITFNDPSGVAPAQANYTVTQKSDGKVLASDQLFVAGQPVTVQGVSFEITGEPVDGDDFFIESSTSQGLLTTVGRLVEGLKNIPDDNPAALKDLLDTTLLNLDNAETSVLETRSSLGGRLNTLDSTKSLLEQIGVTSTKIISDLRDLDLAEAASQLAFESTVLEAAQASYVQVSRLSLFNFF